MARNPEDQVLVARFRRGDDSAFDAIAEAHSAEVAALANRLLGWPQDVDDIVQEVFLAAFKGLATFRGSSSLRTWLFAITVNTCRSHRLRRRLWRRHHTVDGFGVIVAPTGQADKPALDGERHEQVRRAVRTLPGKYREVVVLRYLQELDSNEICRVLGIKPNTLQVRLSRARGHLRERLANVIEDRL